LTENKFANNLFAQEFWTQSHLEHPKTNLLRFLRARRWKLDAAASMLIESLKWRREYSARGVFSKGEPNLNQAILRSGKGFFWGYDKDGRLVAYFVPKMHDMFAQPLEDTFRHIVYQTELSRRLFHPESETLLVIFDLKGISWRSLDLSTMRFVIGCFQDHYPESLGPCLVLNAPWIFWGFFKMIAPLLDPVVASKIRFIDDLNTLRDYVSDEMLLSCYGGSNPFDYFYSPPPPLDSKVSSNDNADAECKLRDFIETGNETSFKEYIESLKSIEKATCVPNYYHALKVLSNGAVNWQSFEVPTFGVG
jgi:hypothetical protein